MQLVAWADVLVTVVAVDVRLDLGCRPLARSCCCRVAMSYTVLRHARTSPSARELRPRPRLTSASSARPARRRRRWRRLRELKTLTKKLRGGVLPPPDRAAQYTAGSRASRQNVGRSPANAAICTPTCCDQPGRAPTRVEPGAVADRGVTGAYIRTARTRNIHANIARARAAAVAQYAGLYGDAGRGRGSSVASRTAGSSPWTTGGVLPFALGRRGVCKREGSMWFYLGGDVRRSLSPGQLGLREDHA